MSRAVTLTLAAAALLLIACAIGSWSLGADLVHRSMAGCAIPVCFP